MILGEKTKDIGTVKVGVKQVVEYPIEPMTGNFKITSPCDCTKVHIDNKNRKITVIYYPKAIPKHLLLRDIYHYETEKIFLIDDQFDTRVDEFRFKAKVVQ